MKKLLTGLTLILTTTTAMPACDQPPRAIYQEHYRDLAIARSLTDYNHNGILDLGDKATYIYDLNNDGQADAYSHHWVRGITVTGVDYNPMPHEFAVDKNHDGTLDLRYRGINARGVASIVEPYHNPAPNTFAEGKE